MHILDVILMHRFDVLIRMHVLDGLLLLLLATTVIAPLFWEFQPQSNNAAGSVVVPKTTLLSLTTLLKHNYVGCIVSIYSALCVLLVCVVFFLQPRTCSLRSQFALLRLAWLASIAICGGNDQ